MTWHVRVFLRNYANRALPGWAAAPAPRHARLHRTPPMSSHQSCTAEPRGHHKKRKNMMAYAHICSLNTAGALRLPVVAHPRHIIEPAPHAGHELALA